MLNVSIYLHSAPSDSLGATALSRQGSSVILPPLLEYLLPLQKLPLPTLQPRDFLTTQLTCTTQ
jgi:hypothetical protein